MKKSQIGWLFTLVLVLLALGLFAYRHSLLNVSAKAHSVTVTWKPVDGVQSYNIYRAEKSGGPYVKIGSSETPRYVDSSVVGATTYYYVVTSVQNGTESAFSGEIQAAVP